MTVVARVPERVDDAVRSLRRPGALFVAGLVVHGADHLKRGMMASPRAVMIAGMVQILLVIVTMVAVWRGSRWVPVLGVVVAFGSVVGFSYAHLLPAWWPAYSDSFVTGARIGVTWFSWVTVAAELGTALIFGVAAARVVARRSSWRVRAPGRSVT